MTIENSLKITPIGDLAVILEEFGAPAEVCSTLAKRIGAVMGPTTGLSTNQVRQKLIDNLGIKGTPNWQDINEILGDASSRIYKGKRPFPK